MTGTSPPGPFRWGSTICSVNAVATAASKALPPLSSIDMPMAVAIQWVDATTPKIPSISGRVVKGVGFVILVRRIACEEEMSRMRPPRQVGRILDEYPGADAQFRREGRHQHAAAAYDKIAERGENALGRIEPLNAQRIDSDEWQAGNGHFGQDAREGLRIQKLHAAAVEKEPAAELGGHRFAVEETGEARIGLGHVRHRDHHIDQLARAVGMGEPAFLPDRIFG